MMLGGLQIDDECKDEDEKVTQWRSPFALAGRL